jgi:hypothetical protein
MYLLFAYDTYYPEGAVHDFICKYDSFKECVDETKTSIFEFDYTNIYDVINDDWYICRQRIVYKDGDAFDSGIEFILMDSNSNSNSDNDNSWQPLTDEVIDKVQLKSKTGYST